MKKLLILTLLTTVFILTGCTGHYINKEYKPDCYESIIIKKPDNYKQIEVIDEYGNKLILDNATRTLKKIK